VGGLGFYCCLSVYPHDISQTNAAMITVLDIEMISKPYLFWGQELQNIAGVGHYTLVSGNLLPGLKSPLRKYLQIDGALFGTLFFSRPRSEGWLHHGRTFSIYLCPLLF